MSVKRAIVTNVGQTYMTYRDFARKHGYPEAAAMSDDSDARPGLRNGDEVTILATDKHMGVFDETLHIVEAADGSRYIIGDKGVKLIEPVIDADRMTADIATLTAKYRELERRIESLEMAQKPAASGGEALGSGKRFDREAVIEQAKADVAKLEEIGRLRDVDLPRDTPFHDLYYRVSFVVNHEKRTVVALVFKRYGGDVVERGIAKCAPDDCFNVHIGRAISLRRALGLPVPDEYLNAPQPEKARVGDVLRTDNGTLLRVVERNSEVVFGKTCEEGSLYAQFEKVIDDSREGVDAE